MSELSEKVCHKIKSVAPESAPNQVVYSQACLSCHVLQKRKGKYQNWHKILCALSLDLYQKSFLYAFICLKFCLLLYET